MGHAQYPLASTSCGEADAPKTSKTLDHVMYGGLGLLLVVTAFSWLGLSMPKTSATVGEISDSRTTTASVNVSATCSMSAGGSGDSEHSATIPNGQKSERIGQTTIKAICNDPGGYAIYAVGYSNDTFGQTMLRSSTLGSNYDIPTNATLSTSTSAWAMKIGAVTGDYTPKVVGQTVGDPDDFTNFHAVPTGYTKVAYYNDGTVPSAGSAITTTYGASISPTQPAGTYVGKVKYVLVHPGISNIITEHDMQHVDQWAGELMVGEDLVATDSRDGKTYTVARLCMVKNGCTPGTTSKDSSMLWMTQNLDFRLSPNTPLTSADTNLTEYQDESGNVFAGYEYANGVITWTPGSTLANPATISDFAYSSAATTVVSGWSNQYTTPYQAEGSVNGNTNSEVYIVTSGNNNRDTIYTSLNACKTGVMGSDNTLSESAAEAYCKHYHVGNYYNYTASIAMNNSSNVADWHEVAPNSICPAGWRLPTGLQNSTDPTQSADIASEYNQMLYANGIASQLLLTDGQDAAGPNAGYASNGFLNIRKSPIWLVRSGNVDATTLYYSSSNGYYWSSTAVSGSLAYSLGYYSGELRPALRNGRYYGFSLRCVAEQ